MSQDAKQELEEVKEQLREKTAEALTYMQESERLRVDTVCFQLLDIIQVLASKREDFRHKYKYL